MMIAMLTELFVWLSGNFRYGVSDELKKNINEKDM